ncbi:hypothetical protein CGZ80_13075 [Rhodopirellula sp. MGV]|nr:hypothetical protein CGZ80_13075 [Rhodopirellula sp. MGV]PNY38155.1 hypothetical protein C2E31_03875 [Rhodopirellula baltica]
MYRVHAIYSLAVVLTIATVATAAPAKTDRSILIGPNDRWDDETVHEETASSQINFAPMINDSFVPTPIPAPITDAEPLPVSDDSTDASPHSLKHQEQKRKSAHANHESSKKKPTVVDRIRDFDRRSNAWFKRTFMGG